MCPPGVDQTTRSPERWCLLAPHLEEKYSVTDHMNYSYHQDMRKFIENDFVWDAFDKLAQYGRNVNKALLALSLLSGRKSTDRSSAIESLPAEIINMIVAEACLEPIDIVSLGLCSHSLWVHALQHIAQHCQKARWAGTPLLCAGSWTTSVPQAIHDMRPDLALDEEQFLRSPRRAGRCPARRFEHNAEQSYIERMYLYRGSVWIQPFNDASITACIPTKSLSGLRRSLEVVVCPKASAIPDAWALRNHTTKEYVSLKAGRPYGNNEYNVHVKGVPWLSVDRALLLRICWSSAYVKEEVSDFEISHYGQQYAHLRAQLKRGKWAGHCFDIIPSTQASQAREVQQEWCDVTSEIVKEAGAWKAVYE